MIQTCTYDAKLVAIGPRSLLETLIEMLEMLDVRNMLQFETKETSDDKHGFNDYVFVFRIYIYICNQNYSNSIANPEES